MKVLNRPASIQAYSEASPTILRGLLSPHLWLMLKAPALYRVRRFSHSRRIGIWVVTILWGSRGQGEEYPILQLQYAAMSSQFQTSV